MMLQTLVFFLAMAGPQDSTNISSIGELERFVGNWMINSDRRSLRAGTQLGDHTINICSSEHDDNFGCPFTSYRTLRASYDPATDVYRAKLKWSGSTFEEHRKSEWLPHDFTGTWDAATRTMTWVNEKPADHEFKFLKVEIVVHGENKQSVSITEVEGDSQIQQITCASFDLIH